jgi:hypothetical protein
MDLYNSDPPPPVPDPFALHIKTGKTTITQHSVRLCVCVWSLAFFYPVAPSENYPSINSPPPLHVIFHRWTVMMIVLSAVSTCF